MAPPTVDETTVRSLVAATTTRLEAAGSPSARLDAELLVSHAFGRDRTWLHAHPDATLDDVAAGQLEDWINQRRRGEPIAYIRGFKEWFGLRVLTDRRALIPRPETELLAEVAIAEVAARLVTDSSTITAWDVGTGSGAVALALGLRFRTALQLGRLRLVASDLSADALELAAENLSAHGLASLVTLASGDLLESSPATSAGADVVTANLPYVASAEVATGSGSLAYEPALALDGGPDGLDVLRRLVAQLPRALGSGAVCLMEVGPGQAAQVRAVAEDLRVRTAVTFIPDLAGIERIVRVARLDA
jgi:release factor glutamine methyltransferase